MADYSVLSGGVKPEPINMVGAYLGGRQAAQTDQANQQSLAGGAIDMQTKQIANRSAQDSLNMSAIQRLTHTAKGIAAIKDDGARNRAYQSVLPHLKKLAPGHAFPDAISQQDAVEFANTLELQGNGSMTPEMLQNQRLQFEQERLKQQSEQFDQEMSYKNAALNKPTQADQPYWVKEVGTDGKSYWVNVRGDNPELIPSMTPGSGDQNVDPRYDPANKKKLASATAEGKVIGEQTGEKTVQGTMNAPSALLLLDDMESAIRDQPATPIGRGYETAAGVFGQGDAAQQGGMAVEKVSAAQLMAYAEKLPGPASDADRIDFKASIGTLSDPLSTRDQKIQAVKQARRSFSRLRAKYGDSSQQPAQQPPTDPLGAPKRVKIDANGDLIND